MSAYPEITLHYFNVRGRGQFIRGLMAHRGIPYIDERIHLKADNSDWPAIRQDRNISGDFQKLPTLQWGDTMINEVLVILGFLQHKLGDESFLSEKENLRHDMLTSSALMDLVTPCINLIWSDVFNPGADVASTTAFMKRRLEMHLLTVNQTLDEWQWLQGMGDRPVMAADAVLWEALDMIRLTFDDHVSFDELDALTYFYDGCDGAGTFKRLLQETPVNITGRPEEPDALAIIHGTLIES